MIENDYNRVTADVHLRTKQRAEDFFNAFCERIITPALNLNYNDLDQDVKDIFFGAKVGGGGITAYSIREALLQAFTGVNNKFVIVALSEFGSWDMLAEPVDARSIAWGLISKNSLNYYGKIDEARIIEISKPTWFTSLKDLFAIMADILTMVQMYQKISTTVIVDIDTQRDDREQQAKINKKIDKVSKKIYSALTSAGSVIGGLLVQENTKGLNISKPPIEVATDVQNILLTQASSLTGYPLTWLAGTGTTGFNGGESDNEIVYSKHKDLANSYIVPILNSIQTNFKRNKLAKLGINSFDAREVVKNLTEMTFLVNSGVVNEEEFNLLKNTIMSSIKNNTNEIR